MLVSLFMFCYMDMGEIDSLEKEIAALKKDLLDTKRQLDNLRTYIAKVAVQHDEEESFAIKGDREDADLPSKLDPVPGQRAVFRT